MPRPSVFVEVTNPAAAAGPTLILGPVTLAQSRSGGVSLRAPVSGTAAARLVPGSLGGVANACGSVDYLSVRVPNLAIATFESLEQPKDGRWSGVCLATLTPEKAKPGTYEWGHVGVFDANGAYGAAKPVRFTIPGEGPQPACSDSQVLIHNRCVDLSQARPTVAAGTPEVAAGADGATTVRIPFSGASYYPVPASSLCGVLFPPGAGCAATGGNATAVKQSTEAAVAWGAVCLYTIAPACPSGRYTTGVGAIQIGGYQVQRPIVTVEVHAPKAKAIPTIVTGTATGLMFSEMVLGLPGLGALAIRAIRRADSELLLGTVVVFAVLICLARVVSTAVLAALGDRS